MGSGHFEASVAAEPGLPERLRAFSLTSGVAAILVGVLVPSGWAFHGGGLKRVQTFLEHVPGRLEVVWAALKGSCASMGAARMACLAASIEGVGASGDLRGWGLIARLQEAFVPVRATLAARRRIEASPAIGRRGGETGR